MLLINVAYAALELAVAKLGHYDPHDDDLMLRAKRLLQKCAHAMISHQELSRQLVCTYLMDFEDHFTSHSYQKLYWTSFESYLNLQDPSPECYVPRNHDTSDKTEPEVQDLMTNSVDMQHDQEANDSQDDGDSSHNWSFEEFEEDEIAQDEVIISSDDKGAIMARASQVTDYRLRSSLYKNLTLWDFVAQIDKVKKTTKNDRDEDGTDSESDSDIEDDLQSSDGEQQNESTNENIPTMPEHLPLTVNQMQKQLCSHSQTRPKCDLQPNHPEWQTHYLQVRKPRLRFVTVPIGPHIPR